MLRIGTAGWSYDDWKGTVYPPGTKDTLAYLAGLFSTLEINVTFYRTPTPDMARSWRDRVSGNPDFSFTAKASREWTHGKGSGEEVRAYLETFEVLQEEGRLGAILFQYPWSFQWSEENRDRILAATTPFAAFRRVVEVRHRSFETPSYYRFLTDNDLAMANIDQPLLGKAFRPSERVTASPGYVRLHGRNYRHWIRHDEPWQRYDYLYDASELRQWKRRIDRVLEGVEETYVVTNNHYKGQAVVNALELMEMVGQRSGELPGPLKDLYPDHLTKKPPESS